MTHNRRILLILLSLCILSIILSSCKSSKQPCDAYGSIYWDNPKVDSVAVLKDNSIYIPYVPVMDAQAFHLNTTEKGTYKVLLKAGDDVIEARSIVLK